MRKRSVPLPVVVAVTVLALALGSATTASASGLTRAAVKKIAVKAVKKQAPSLSVAHAATADTATTAAAAATATNASAVGGATAAQLRTMGYKYALPTQAATISRTYAFPGLPPGTYLASYALTANMGTAGEIVLSGIYPSASGNVAAAGYGSPSGSFSRVSATTILTMTSTGYLYLGASSGTFTLNAFNENTVSFVPIDTQVTGSAVSSRPGSSSRPGDGS